MKLKNISAQQKRLRVGDELKALQDMSLEELWQLFPIVLQKHNPDYAMWYSSEEESLIDLLRDFNICRINHIGSTAVAGLIAKPIVDILLELPATYDVNAAAQLLHSNGWIIMQQDDTQKTIDLNKGYTPNGFADKVYHLHIRPVGDWGELYFTFSGGSRMPVLPVRQLTSTCYTPQRLVQQK